jgi:hypothetical protein
MIGGKAIVDAMIVNVTLQEVCLADNKIGADIAALLAARSHGTTKHLCHQYRIGMIYT